MILAQLSNITFSFPGRTIIESASHQFKDGCRTGLIGANGIGKTTLFRLIAGERIADSGEIHYAKGLRIGFLEQTPVWAEGTTVRNEIERPFTELIEMESRLRGFEKRFEETDDLEVFQQYDALADHFQRSGGYTYRARIHEILNGLGFSDAVQDRPITSFSGGEQSRIMLARLLLEAPNLLLLDEPTNHLDIRATEWLEKYLKGFSGGIVFISHDRYFLDRIATDILELEHRRLTLYTGNFSAYIEQKAERREHQQKLFKLQQAKIEKMEDFVRRNMAGQKTKQAQSTQKALDRMERIEAPTGQGRSMRFHLDTDHGGGRIAIEARDLSLSFDSRVLFAHVDLRLHRGEIVGMIGENGSGKSSFLKIIAGELEPNGGVVALGYRIKPAYFDQHLRDLDPAKPVIEEIWQLIPQATQLDVRSHLGRFLFSGEDVFKLVSQLSGGERARLALAKLMLFNANLLLLDEPTNHLDVAARDSLEEALLEYPGTVLMVTHDRYLLDRVAARIWALEDHTITDFIGNYSDYRRWKDMEKIQEATPEIPTSAPVARSDLSRRRKSVRSIRVIEKDITRFEIELREIHAEMKQPALATNWQALDDLARQERTIRDKLDAAIAEWEDAGAFEESRRADQNK